MKRFYVLKINTNTNRNPTTTTISSTNWPGEAYVLRF